MTPASKVYACQSLPGVEWEVREIGAVVEWTVSSTLPQCDGWLLDSGSTWDDPEDALKVARERARKASDDAIRKGFVTA